MRWTVHAASLKSVTDNYLVFHALWEEVKEAVNDSEIWAREISVDVEPALFHVLPVQTHCNCQLYLVWNNSCL